MCDSRLRSRRWITTLVILACFTLAASAASRGAAAPDTVPRRNPSSLRDSPGWYPIVDPESTSVLIGRRLNASLVSKPFRGGARSMDELGRAICRGLHRSDRDSLLALCIRDDEFRDILWREFPQSRPLTGLTWQDGWISLDQRLHSGISGAVGDYAGDDWKFVRFERDSVAQFKNFRLHLGLRMYAVSDQGKTVPILLVRSVAERKGRFKIYSTRD
jgi:hypothetical protein